MLCFSLFWRYAWHEFLIFRYVAVIVCDIACSKLSNMGIAGHSTSGHRKQSPISSFWVQKLTKRLLHKYKSCIAQKDRNLGLRPHNVLAGPSHAHLGMSLVLCYGNADGAVNSLRLHRCRLTFVSKWHFCKVTRFWAKNPCHSTKMSHILQLVIWNSKTLEHSPERRFLRTWWFAAFIRDSSRHAVLQCQSKELLWHLWNTSCSCISSNSNFLPLRPFGNIPMQWLQISSWFLTIRVIRVPKWWGLRNLQISEANISFLLWSRALVNLVVMNQILALDAAVLRWKLSVPSMFGWSVAIAWRDGLSAKQPQILHIQRAWCSFPTFQISQQKAYFGFPNTSPHALKKLAWQNATKTLASVEHLKTLLNGQLLVNICCQLSVGMEATASLHGRSYRHVMTSPTFGKKHWTRTRTRNMSTLSFLCTIWTRPNLFWTAGPILLRGWCCRTRTTNPNSIASNCYATRLAALIQPNFAGARLYNFWAEKQRHTLI